MTSLDQLFADLAFRLNSLDWLGILDLLLVTSVFFVTLIFLQRSRVAHLMRGIVLLAVVLLIVAVFLPLPTFDWIIGVVFLVMLIATPVIFAPEIRRLLENIGRTVGLSRSVQESTAETVIPELIRALESLSPNHTGALMVLEAEQSLSEVIRTGIPVNGRISAELLQTIFHEKTPLHDGAIIIRGEEIMAAGCVLPLTEQQLNGNHRRYGTRHRAAVGMSEKADGLTLVVSEETGHISIAYMGNLYTHLDMLEIRTRLVDFYKSQTNGTKRAARLAIWPTLRHYFSTLRHQIAKIGLLNVLLTLLLSAALAVITWFYVIGLTNPTQRKIIENVPVHVTEHNPDLMLMNDLPETIAVELQSTADIMPSLTNEAISATVDLQRLEAGEHNVPIVVVVDAPLYEIISMTSAAVEVSLANLVTKTLPVTVDMTLQNLSAAYEVEGEPEAMPSEVVISGPQPLVEQVAAVVTTLVVDNPKAPVQVKRPLQAVDAQGNVVEGVVLDVREAQVDLGVAQKQNVRDVGVRALTSGAPPEGYWLSGLSTIPSNITIQGDTAVLDQIGTFIDTLPIDISQATGQLHVQVPLDIPPGIEVTDTDGQPVRNVTVAVQVFARSSDLAITRTVEILNPPEGLTVAVVPENVDLLLSGPLPILNAIQANPDLVRVFIEAAHLQPGQKYDLEPEIMVPEDIRVQMAPASITVDTVPPSNETSP